MKKLSNEIELAVYQMLMDSPLKTTINGKIYRNGMRPFGAVTEDIIVSFLAGIDGQFQNSVVNINVYVPDISYNGTFTKDIVRLSIIEKAFGQWLFSRVPNEFLTSLDNLPVTVHEEEIHQHFLNIRLRIKYNSLN